MAEVTLIPFAKLSGSGNDFILVDDRDGVLAGMDLSALARRVCHRTTSVGADGLIVVRPSDEADFRWEFLNSDGSRAEMCGNGGRCAARFAAERGIAPASMSFVTMAGVVRAEVAGRVVKIELTRPKAWVESMTVNAGGEDRVMASVNTGVPHAVIFLADAASADVAGVGRAVRFHPRFAPAGTNVNFVSVTSRGGLRVRTYERGVEGETQACGTGSVAAALAAWRKGLVDTRVDVQTTGGEVLTVHLEPVAGEEPRVFLEGAVTMICEGTIHPEAYR